MDLKRLEVKYIRDRAKSLYKKEDSCYICGSQDKLELHHFSSVTMLWNKWKRDNSIKISSTEDIEKYRDLFIEDHTDQLYNKVVTLCKECHQYKLHKVYGKSPALATAEKQERWCKKQRDKRLSYGTS